MRVSPEHNENRLGDVRLRGPVEMQIYLFFIPGIWSGLNKFLFLSNALLTPFLN